MARRVTTRRVKSVGLLVLIAGLVLGGCSSPNRAAGNLGVGVCIVNESSRAATVVFTKRDTARGRVLWPRGLRPAARAPSQRETP